MRRPVGALSMRCVLHRPATITSAVLLGPEVTLHEEQVRVEAIIPSPTPLLWITRIPKAEASNDVQPGKRFIRVTNDFGDGPSREAVVPGSVVFADGHGCDGTIMKNGNSGTFEWIAGELLGRLIRHVKYGDAGGIGQDFYVEVTDRSRVPQPSTTALGICADCNEAHRVHGRQARVDGAVLFCGERRCPAYSPVRRAFSCASVGRGKFSPKRSAQMWPAPVSSPSAASWSA